MVEEKNKVNDTVKESDLGQDAKTTPSVKAEAKKDEKVAKEEKKTSKSKEIMQVETKAADVKTGMTIRIYQKIKETNIKGEEKERVQYFDGLVIARKHGNEAGGTFTVRKVSGGVGVEKIYPVNLPSIEKIEVKKIAKIRRAKLTFLKTGYKKKLKETMVKQAK